MLYNIPNPHGGEVYSKAVEIDFSANINPLGTPEAVKEAVRDSLPLLSQYPDPYCRALVGAIAEFEGVPAERVLCGNGAAELIFSLCAALGPKRALLPVPSFSEYRTALEAAGCETEFYFMEQSEDFALTERFLPVLEGFGGDMLLLCNPNNPTGQVIDPVLLEEIRDICARKGIFLFIDECFLDLTQGGRGAEPGAAAAGRRADALIEGLYQELRHGGAAAGLLPVRRPGAADPDGPRHPGLERIHSRPDGGDRRPGAAGIFGPGQGDHPRPAAASGGGAGGAGADGDPLPHQFSAVFLPPCAGGATAGAGAANPGLRQLSRPGAGLVSHGGKAAGAEPAPAGRNKGDSQWLRTS